MKPHFIVKESGQEQRFSKQKLNQSLKRCGLDDDAANAATFKVTQQINNKMRTRDIFKITQKTLHQLHRPFAYRYSLKRAIFELGPTGYPFERLIGKLFTEFGYQVKTGIMLQGKCVQHEVDVVAQNENEKIWVECKFHNDQGVVVDLKTSLYVYGRYLDLKEYEDSKQSKTMWLASNTRFSSEAIQFATCRGMNLLGWDYPNEGGLNVLLDRHQVYPITAISTLNRKQKLELMNEGILTTRDFQKHRNKIVRLGLNSQKWQQINHDLEQLHQAF